MEYFELQTATSSTGDKAHLIRKTTAYDKFSFVNGEVSNREIDPNSKQRIKDSMIEFGFKRCFPIIVNSKGMVLDGQHRFVVAKELGLPIYFTVDDSIQMSMVPKLNATVKKWDLKDYVHAHTNTNADCRWVAELCHSYKVNPRMILNMVPPDGRKGSSSLKVIQGGGLKITEHQKSVVLKCLQVSTKLQNYLPIHWKSQSFVCALKVMVGTEGFDADRLFHKLEYQSKKLVPCVRSEHYLDIFNDVYNYKARDEDKLYFRDR